MTALSEIADFLLSLMHNGKAREEFTRDPDGTFAKHGLHGVTGQDVRDAHLMMCDDGSVHPKPGHGGGGGGGGGGHHDDPVHAVQHIYNNYEVTEVDASSHTSIGEINVLDIDDRDTTVIDSFNSDDDTNVVAVQDNDTTTNNTVDDHSTNTDVDVTNVEDSFNEGGPAEVHTDHEVVTDPAPDAVEDPVPDETPVDPPAEATVEEPEHHEVAPVEDHGADVADDFADHGAFDPAAAG